MAAGGVVAGGSAEHQDWHTCLHRQVCSEDSGYKHGLSSPAGAASVLHPEAAGTLHHVRVLRSNCGCPGTFDGHGVHALVHHLAVAAQLGLDVSSHGLWGVLGPGLRQAREEPLSTHPSTP